MPAGGKGIDWLLNLDAKTQGAVEVIKALQHTKSAADVAGEAIDRAMRKMDKLPKSMAGDAGWSKGAMNLQTLTKGAQLTEREFGFVKTRTAQVKEELERLGTTSERTVTPLWKEMFKGQALLDAIQWSAKQAFQAVEWGAGKAWDMLRQAGGEERMGRVFANMLGDDEGRATLEYLEKFSKLSEFTDDQVKGVGNELLRAGLRGAGFRNALAAVVDVAASASNKLEGMGEAAASIARIALTGRVDNRILRGLRLDPHAVEEQLSRDLGLAPKAIKKKLEEGSLKGVDAMDSIFTAIEAKTGKQLGALGEGMNTGFLARLDKLKDIPEEISKSLRTTQGFQDISDTIDRLVRVFGPDSETGQKFMASLARMLDVIGSKIREVNWEAVAGFIGDTVTKLTNMVDPLLKLVDALGTAVKLFSYIKSPGSAIADIRDWWNDRRSGQAAADVANAAGWGDISEGMVAGLKAGKRGVMAASEDVARGATEAARDALQVRSPSIVFEDIGVQVAEGMALGMERGRSRVYGAMGTMVAPPSLGDLSGMSHGSTFNAGGLTVNINVMGAGVGGSAAELAQAIAATAPDALLAALEQAAVQAGLQ